MSENIPPGLILDPRAYGARPGEREVIAEMIRLRRDGWGYLRITHHLNERGIPARFGGPWNQVSVRRILKRLVPELCPPRDVTRIPQDRAVAHVRDLDRQRKARAAARSERSESAE